MQERACRGGKGLVMRQPPPAPLSRAAQRALAAFLDGRLPAGQLHGELLRGAEAAAHATPMPMPPPLERAAPASSAG